MATVNLGFENNLWEMADKLRGNIEASEYKHVVLGLIFLKYISDAFEERYNELVAEGEGFEEDIDAYTEENVFFRTEGSPLGVHKIQCQAACYRTDYRRSNDSY
jgi:type I restriction enzyme M protein